MLLHTEHLVPGMVLDKDIELRAGSFLITRRELGDGRLTEKAIKSIQNFAPQIVPISDRVFIRDECQVYGFHIIRCFRYDPPYCPVFRFPPQQIGGCDVHKGGFRHSAIGYQQRSAHLRGHVGVFSDVRMPVIF